MNATLPALRDDTFRAICALMHQAIGLHFSDSKKPLISSRLGPRIQRLGLGGYEDYMRLIERPDDGGEFQMAVDLLTTNETYFFREPQHYNDLAERLAHVGPGQDFKVWSAASSSGEEAYSAAMLMSDQLPGHAWQIIGTDLSTAMVESARRGLYPMDRARMVPPDYLKRFCLKGQ
ncbi:MAG: SAM-dependent methyltransferase, partial [Burkholderiales bacterium PBB5]